MNTPTEFNDEARRLDQDLEAVAGQITLCRELMKESPGIQHDEALKDLVGFLEACGERMGEVIEAGANGLLSEAAFARCFVLNDALQKTLEAERTGHKTIDDGFGKDEGKEGSLLDLATPNGGGGGSSSSAAQDVLGMGMVGEAVAVGTDESPADGTNEVVGIPMSVSAASPSVNPFDTMPPAPAPDSPSTPNFAPPPVPASPSTDTAPLDDFLSSLSVSNLQVDLDTFPPAPASASAASDASAAAAAEPMVEIAMDDVNSYFDSLDTNKKS